MNFFFVAVSESLQVLAELGISLVGNNPMDISSGTRFDAVSAAAYKRDDISDADLSHFCSLAPNTLSNREKVRYMEIMASSASPSDEMINNPSEESQTILSESTAALDMLDDTPLTEGCYRFTCSNMTGNVWP